MKAFIFALSLISISALADDFFDNPTQRALDAQNTMQMQDLQRQQMLQQQSIQIQGVGSPNAQSGSYDYNAPAYHSHGWDR